MAAASKEAVDLLRRGVPTDRWLLVFDNADDPERLRRYFPQGGSGHILVTSRNQSWSQHGDALPVDVFLREESVEHLQRRAPGLSDEDADQVATAVGDLPLAVEQAAAWIAETATPSAPTSNSSPARRPRSSRSTSPPVTRNRSRRPGTSPSPGSRNARPPPSGCSSSAPSSRPSRSPPTSSTARR